MAYMNMTQSANPTSSSPLSHVNSNGVSGLPSSLNSSSSSLFGSVSAGKQWTTIGQTSSTSTSTLAQQWLMKPQQPQHLLNNQQTNSLNSSSSSSHFDNIIGLTMPSTLTSSSQASMEKKFELQQEDFPPLPHRSNSHDPASSSSSSIAPPLYQTQFSSPSSSSNLHQTLSNGFNSSQQQQQQQHSQSQSPISFKSTIDPLSTLISRRTTSITNKPSSLTSTTATTSSATTNSQQLQNSSSTTTNSNGLPTSTITDQYGLVGLLHVIQQAEKNPETSSLLNYDLTTLGLSMDSSNDLYPSFLSPFSDSQARPYEIDYQVPFEYQMGLQIREKLPPLNFNALNDDTLFFLFYLFGNDHVQLLTAAELYRRDWRYHKEERLWLTRIKNIMPDQKHDTYETGVYCVFDVQLWRKTHKSMRIDYEKLDGPVLKQHDLLTSKFLQQQGSGPSYGPMSYNTNVSR